MGFLSDFLAKIPDCFNKSEKSNIGKILLIVSEQLDDIKQTLLTVEEWRDINRSQGKSLDLLGDNVSQKRGLASDEVYRVMIRGKQAQMISDGTTDRLIKTLAVTLNCSVSEINVQFGYERTLEQESAMISITRAPLTALNEIGMSAGQFIQIVNNVVAGGIKVADVHLEGTFRFSQDYTLPVYDSGYGFGIGTLGALFKGDNTFRLPI